MCSGTLRRHDEYLVLIVVSQGQCPGALFCCISDEEWHKSKGKPFLPPPGIQLDIQFLCTLSAVCFLVCPKGRESAWKAFGDPQGKSWMKQHACVRAWIDTIEKGVPAVSVHIPLKLADYCFWHVWVSTLLSYWRAYSGSPSSSQLKD